MLMGGIVGSMVLLPLLRKLFSYFRGVEVAGDNAVRVESFFTSRIFLRYIRYHTLLSPTSIGKVDPTCSSSPLASTLSFGYLLSHLTQFVWVLVSLCLLLSVPIYVLKQSNVEAGNEENSEYVTHSHTYNWLWTMAFVSGITPAIILLVMCLVCLLFFTLIINSLGATNQKQHLAPTSDTDQHSHFLLLKVWFIFIVNALVVGTVNGLYLWSTLVDLTSDIRFWVQFYFGLFSFLWSFSLRRELPSKIKRIKVRDLVVH